MAKVQIINVEVLDNPSPYFNPFQFQITFDCIENLSDDLEWKIIYVGSAESEDYDQNLDSVLVGPIPAGRHKFVFQADPPKPELIPLQDAVGVTVVIITCTYHNQEFVRVGYYVNNEYGDPFNRENPPEKPDFSKLVRNILDTKPRVTRFKINWDDKPDPDYPSYLAEENIPPSPQANFGSSIEETPGIDMSAPNTSGKNGPLSSSNHSTADLDISENYNVLQAQENCTESMDMRMFVE